MSQALEATCGPEKVTALVLAPKLYTDQQGHIPRRLKKNISGRPATVKTFILAPRDPSEPSPAPCPQAPSGCSQRGQRCISWSYVLVPLQQPGTYSVKNLEEPEEVQVFDTDYTAFALMFSKRQLTNQFILRIHLLSRSWAIKTKVMNKFICLAKDKMLSKDHVVFPNLRASTWAHANCTFP
ncbi:epididymal-specific lipocalin-12 [Erinaceus europaeus]|uniref:Epididymal-specific lipocalin-12 n=1 Tax=Erinaceus europaeus TaxID=9365 RepID=A0ABM3Y1P5_ERIEU|nr:epididymal-specific lipocalin-12 [Erinaceus europaeus]